MNKFLEDYKKEDIMNNIEDWLEKNLQYYKKL